MVVTNFARYIIINTLSRKIVKYFDFSLSLTAVSLNFHRTGKRLVDRINSTNAYVCYSNELVCSLTDSLPGLFVDYQ